MNNKKITNIRWLLLAMLMTITSISFAQSIRKHYEEMTTHERDVLMDAYWTQGGPMGTVGLNADIANFHSSNFSAIHFNTQPNDVFFAWHRYASFELERAMKDGESDEWLSMAYWDWTLSNSKSDDLWNNDWIGQFDAPWNLGRFPTSGVTLPTQANIDNALLESNFYQFSRWSVESNTIHVAAHNWTGSVMGSGNSPKDPAFFLHHNMVDRIWAEWYEIYGVAGTNYYTPTSLPGYPSIDPDDIADPRSLGIFYAQDGLATLDKYSVSNTYTSSEKFGYQFTIEAGDDFIVPNGNDAEFRSCNEIVLLPGFEAELGSTFGAKLDTDCNFSTAPLMAELTDGSLAVADKDKNKESDVKFEAKKDISLKGLKSFPNPFEGRTTIEYVLSEDTEISLEVYNITGQRVRRLIDKQTTPKGTHRVDFIANDLPNGIYYCSLITGVESVETIKLVLSR